MTEGISSGRVAIHHCDTKPPVHWTNNTKVIVKAYIRLYMRYSKL